MECISPDLCPSALPSLCLILQDACTGELETVTVNTDGPFHLLTPEREDGLKIEFGQIKNCGCGSIGRELA